MKTTGKELLREKRLYSALQGSGPRLTVQQYRTIRGWIRAGQFETAENALRKRGLL